MGSGRASSAGLFNSVDAGTGDYLLPPVPVAEAAALARRLLAPGRTEEAEEVHRAPLAGIDLRDLAASGWGAVFGEGTDPQVREALRPLLDHRRAQASRTDEGRYRELTCRPGETAPQFLDRHRAGRGPVDPRRLPCFLLLVGDPEAIPYGFQHQLGVQYAVGRLSFDEPEGYARYAAGVLAAETQVGTGTAGAPRAVFFGVQNPGDRATALSCRQLVEPLARAVERPGWQIETVLGERATKARLAAALAAAPRLLFTASHGLGFRPDDPRQRDGQGALLCADWPGPGSGPVPAEAYFAGHDLGAARLPGLVAFHFACHGLGTPRFDSFARLPRQLAPRALVSRLPQRLLAAGALAVIGHVDRAWGHSFLWPGAGPNWPAFESTLKLLMDGWPVGAALAPFGQRYAELSSELLDRLEADRGRADDDGLATLWTARNDARSYALLGDPAVRIAVPRTRGSAPPARPPRRRQPTGGTTGPPSTARGGRAPATWTEAAPRVVHRTTDITAPGRLPLGRRGVVTVRLTRTPEPESAALRTLALKAGPPVEVHLHADPSEIAVLGEAVQSLAVEPEGDSRHAVFHVRGLRRGRHELVLDFRQEVLVGTARLLVEVVDAQAAEEQQRVTALPLPLAGSGGSGAVAPDLELRVVTRFAEGRTALSYVLHSPGGTVPFHHLALTGPVLRGAPEQFQSDLLRQVEAGAGRWADLELLGNLLYRDLFPDGMRAAYRLWSGIRTLQVTSDEPWIPWELIKPYDYADPTRLIDHDFLCLRFEMTRWLAGPGGPAGEIRVRRGACLEAARAPGEPPLRGAAGERRWISGQLLGKTPGVVDLTPQRADREAVEGLLDGGGIQLWHLCGHGRSDLARPDGCEVVLADGWPLQPRDLAGARERHVARDRPLVFFNACRVAQQGFELTRLGGWAAAWVDRARCGAFLGPLWAVDDGSARAFAVAFYQALRDGATLGRAVKRAQQQLAPDDAARLAYSVYGQPNARVLL